jgi:hypothetical protein
LSLDALSRRLQAAGVDPVPPGVPASKRAVLVGGPTEPPDWAELHAQRDDESVTLAFADYVIPQCPLLSAERATAVATPLSLHVPADSAWVCMRVDLARFSTSAGRLDEEALRHALQSCVDIGDAMHDVVQWSSPGERHDAWLNRRLAIIVTGIGDLVAAAGDEPACHTELRRLNQVMLDIRRTLQSRSHVLANESDRLPAITLSDPSHRLPAGSVRDDWRRRWQQAVRVSLVRHRNLLVLSPWSLFPAEGPADLRYAEFLPLLRHADAVAFDKTVSTSHWNLNEFKRFCQRTQAVLQQRTATSLIAEPV